MPLSCKSFRCYKIGISPKTASPGRCLVEKFIHLELPKILQTQHVDVLEIGCGSGSLLRLLEDGGFLGTYTGIDIENRFHHPQQSSFVTKFIQGDAHNLQTDQKFNLIISNSALEHIADDKKLLIALMKKIKKGGYSVHFVPTGWALFAYLWHGYRQYTLSSLAERFAPNITSVYALGGMFSWGLHICLITASEVFFRTNIRRKLPTYYHRLLTEANNLDRYMPCCPLMYAVVQVKS